MNVTFQTPTDILQQAFRSVDKHEGCKLLPYTDTEGYLTIGRGYNLTTRGVTQEWADSQTFSDINFFYQQLFNNFPWYQKLDEVRQVILIDMAFMGWNNFLKFHQMIYCLSIGDYDGAANEMENSLWGKQDKGKAKDLIPAMRSGVYNV